LLFVLRAKRTEPSKAVIRSTIEGKVGGRRGREGEGGGVTQPSRRKKQSPENKRIQAYEAGVYWTDAALQPKKKNVNQQEYQQKKT